MSTILHKGRALKREINSMPDEMKNHKNIDMDAIRKRLLEAQERSGLSFRQVSIQSGNGHGYFHSVVKDGKEPSVGNLARICKVLNVSMSYVLYGYNISPETEKIIQALEDNPSKRAGIFALLKE